jgi:outer membrane receptor protein involved in Fe transport
MQFYNWHMSSNPTYWLDDPANGDQILQVDRRWIYGGKYETNFPVGNAFFFKLGAEGRYDDIPRVGVFHTKAHDILSVTSLHSVTEGSAAVYSEVNWQILPSLRAMAGLRGDTYSFDVTPIDPGSTGGSATDSILSPKVGVQYELTPWLELYGNWGQGFHSNDARGVVNLGQEGLARGEGYEFGGRIQVGDFNFTAAYWWLDEDDELIFVGDTNSVEPRGASARDGYELVLFWRPFEWLALDGVYTQTYAKFVGVPANEQYIPASLEQAGEFGVSAIWPEYEASMRLRYIGPYPLLEDNSERAEGDMLINLRGAWKPGRFTFSIELLNALDHEGKDIVYWYTTRLPGEPAGGFDGRVSRAEEPRTIRVGMKVTF